jgi:hypothetical protein
MLREEINRQAARNAKKDTKTFSAGVFLGAPGGLAIRSSTLLIDLLPK